jgi:DNA primase
MKTGIVKIVLENHPLVEYLASRGFHPASTSAGRLKYLCPLHNDSNPSFYVFTDNEFQRFHCFGCSGHGDVINFVSLHDNCTITQAIGKLLKGLDVKYDEMLDDFAEEISVYEKTRTLEEISLNLSLLFHSYLETTGFDPIEVQFVEKVFQKIDSLILAADIEQLQDVEHLIVTEGLPKRSNSFHDTKEHEVMRRHVKKSLESDI